MWVAFDLKKKSAIKVQQVLVTDINKNGFGNHFLDSGYCTIVFCKTELLLAVWLLTFAVGYLL